MKRARPPGKIVVYRDRKGLWRWRALAANGRIVADSGEGYCRSNGMYRGLARTRRIMRGPLLEKEPWQE